MKKLMIAIVFFFCNTPLYADYVNNGDGTVTDTSTGLMWQQATATNTMNWQNALDYCENLTLAGYSDWRLPTVEELRSIVDHSRYDPAIDRRVFRDTFASFYWSSSPSAYGIRYAWGVGFYSGDDGHSGSKGHAGYVRAVRAGQSIIGSFGHLTISPTNKSVSNSAGTTTFSVSNTDTSPSTMAWTASVTSGGDWLSITSGSSGSNSGTITCGYTANTTASSRTGTIRVTANGAEGSPQDITVTQAGGSKPTVQTGAAGTVATNSVTLNGTINPNGLSTTYYFEYGTTTSYGSKTPGADGGSATTVKSVSANITGLTANTTYHFRLVATNSAGTAYGVDQTFTTSILFKFTLTADKSYVQEGDTIKYTITASQPSVTDRTLIYSITSDSATPGTDFSPASGNVIFLAGETVKTVIISIVNDGVAEFAEGIKFNLMDSTQSLISSHSALITEAIDIQVGSLNVTISPANAVTAGGQWQVGNTGVWNNSEATISNLTVGNHTVSFKNVTGWTTPANQPITIENGKTATATGTYTVIGTVPTVTTTATTAITANTATLNGTVNPNNLNTTYYFEYGTTTSYGSYTATKSITAGDTPVSVTATLSGLAPKTTFYFRLVASNSEGETNGENQTFKTTDNPSKPTVITNNADDITSNSVTLKAFVNPNGYETKWFFEYREAFATDYIETSESTLSAGFQSQKVSVSIPALKSNTQYSFRIVAINDAGTSIGNPADFKTLPKTEVPNIKAIIVAGGGPQSSNNLWDETLKCSNAAYKALVENNITKDKIYYLNPVKATDADLNEQFDDVSDSATKINLQHAIVDWAVDAENLLIYMVDHGGPKQFLINQGEKLTARELDSWLDELQPKISGKIIIVYDACKSGSFISELKPPIGKEKQRIVVASAMPDNPACFVTQGTLSFSWLFWANVANGYKFYDSYVNAKKAMQLSFEQTAMIDTNGNGIPDEKEDQTGASDVHICSETATGAPAPEIGSICAVQTIPVTQTKATISVDNVTSIEGIRRVWAVITPPNFMATVNTENPVTDDQMPSIDLLDKGNGSWSVEYKYFDTKGIYSIVVFAVDKLGYLSEPKITTVTVGDSGNTPEIIVLTESSPNYTITQGSYVRIFGSSGVNTVNVKSAARVECVNFPGANQINIEESSFQCKIKRSGATVYITGDSTMSIKIPATKTAQTLRFGDGSSTLVITGGKVMLGTQEIKMIEAAVGVPVNGGDTSEGLF